MEMVQIRSLAPDPAAFARGQKVASQVRKIQGLGQGQGLLWGEFFGSAHYLAQFDTKKQGWKCSCPSRKQPCKHVLGLLIVHCLDPDSMPEATVPELVQAWRDRRSKAAQTEKAKSGSVDVVAQDKRVQAREQRITQGLSGLQRWMEDLAQQGLGRLQDGSEFEVQARRLIDAQAPGLSTRLVVIGEGVGDGADWPGQVAEDLGRLALLVHAARQDLNPDLRERVRNHLGWRVKQAGVRATGERTQGDWLIAGQRLTEEDRGMLRLTWLLRGQQVQMLMDFAPSFGGGQFEQPLPIGWVLPATLALYPDGHRALIAEQCGELRPLEQAPAGLRDFQALLGLQAQRLQQDPFLARVAAVLENIRILRHKGRFYAIDQEGEALPLTDLPWWRVLALSGGRPVSLFMNIERGELYPKGLWAEGRWNAAVEG
ncbi:MAG: hypothetical protein ACI9VR_003104 [Cognaticolwellia sp.]|jgi:hypothetical protein